MPTSLPPHPNPPPPQALTWNSGSLDAFLAEASQLVRELDALLAAIKDAVAKSQGVLGRWQRELMFERKEGRVARFDELGASMRDLIATRHAAVAGGERLQLLAAVLGCLNCCLNCHLDSATHSLPQLSSADGGRAIAEHLAALSRTLGVDTSSAAWTAFVSYLSDIVVDGLAKSVVASLNHLHSQARTWGWRRLRPGLLLAACPQPALCAHLLPRRLFPLPPPAADQR